MRPAELKTLAIYHASFQIIKRSAGRSSVAAAAYRSAERLVDERTGDVHDYARKQGVAETFIMAPSGSPDWALDRNQLWSTVELTEKRKGAQLARELNVALPIELSRSESKELLQSYVQKAFVDQGMIADIAMHDMDSENPHAHIMLTLREIKDGVFCNKNRDWNAKEKLVAWREGWEKEVNKQLERLGHEARVDHRSLKDQGIERMPTLHMGPHASAMEKKGIETDRGNHNRDVLSINEMLAKLTDRIEKGMQLLKDSAKQLTLDKLSEAKEMLRSTLAEKGSALQGAVDRKNDEQMREREREKEREKERMREQAQVRSRREGLGHSR